MPDPTQVDASYQLRGLPGWLTPPYTAGGDLDGSYPDPTVVGLQGQPIDPTPPTTGQVLTWTGSEWSAQASSGSFGLAGINPSVGPFTGSPLTVDHSRGLLASAGPALTMELASLTQAGVIGTAGGQQIRGPIYLADRGLAASPPSWNSQPYSLVLQNGQLAFRSDADGVETTSPGIIEWLGAGSGQGMTVYSAADFFLSACSVASGYVQLHNYSEPSSIIMYDSAQGITINDPYYVYLVTTSSFNRFAVWRPSTTGTGSAEFALQDGTGHNPVFMVQGFPGVYGTTLDGTVVKGGVITTIGSTPPGSTPTGPAGGSLGGTYPNPSVVSLQGYAVSASAPTSGYVLAWSGSAWTATVPTVAWSGVTGTPTTLAGYGITNAIATGSAAGGDLSGTYPNPTVAQLQGRPMAATAPTSGQVLAWSGSAWAPAAGGGTPTSISNGGSSVSLDGSGNLTSSIAGNNAISQNVAGTTVIGGAFGTLTLSSTGAVTLLGVAGSEVAIDASGYMTVQCGTSANITLSNPTGGGSFYLHSDGSCQMTDVAGGNVNLDGSGNVSLIDSVGGFIVTGGGGQNIGNTSGSFVVSNSSGVWINYSGIGGVGFFGAIPAPLQTAAGLITGYTANSSASILYVGSTFTGNLGTTAYTIGDLFHALKVYGLLKH